MRNFTPWVCNGVVLFDSKRAQTEALWLVRTVNGEREEKFLPVEFQLVEAHRVLTSVGVYPLA